MVFSDKDMGREVYIGNDIKGIEWIKLGELITLLDRTYSSTFAVQFKHISDLEQQNWLQGPS